MRWWAPWSWPTCKATSTPHSSTVRSCCLVRWPSPMPTARSGDESSAMSHFEEGLALGRASENPFAICLAAANFGRFVRKHGDAHRSALLLAEALESYLQQRDYGCLLYT